MPTASATSAPTRSAISPRPARPAAGDRDGLRPGPLSLPNLTRLGLGAAAKASTGTLPPGLARRAGAAAVSATASRPRRGKDTPSGHWEMAGVPVPFDWGYFPDDRAGVSRGADRRLVAEAELPGILGNKPRLGHRRSSTSSARSTSGPASRSATPRPIRSSRSPRTRPISASTGSTTSARSRDALLDPMNVGRVIARPFVGETPATFKRTGNRRDYRHAAARADPARPAERSRAARCIAHRQDRRHLRPSRHRQDLKAPDNMALFDRDARSASTRPATATSSSPISSTSTSYTAIAATCPAMPRRWRPSTPPAGD